MSMQPFNVLRYENGQHYDAHYDVFDPESYGPQSSQRVCSLLASSSYSSQHAAFLLHGSSVLLHSNS